MTLNLSTLKVGDKIGRYDTGATATVVYAGSRVVVADRDMGEFTPDPARWSVIVPPLPSLVTFTDPVTLYAHDDDESQAFGWSTSVSGRTFVNGPAITLYPPGAEIDGKRYAVCELDDDGDIDVFASREFGLWATPVPVLPDVLGRKGAT